MIGISAKTAQGTKKKRTIYSQGITTTSKTTANRNHHFKMKFPYNRITGQMLQTQ